MLNELLPQPDNRVTLAEETDAYGQPAGETPAAEFAQFYPHLRSTLYDESTLDLAVVLERADVVLVHEWNSHELVRRIGEYRAAHPGFRLFFHRHSPSQRHGFRGDGAI